MQDWTTLIITSVICSIAYHCSRWLFGTSKVYLSSEASTQAEWNSRTVSTFHALFAVYSGYLCIFELHSGGFGDYHDAAFGQNELRQTFLFVTAGYLLFDLVLCLQHRSSFGDVGTILHHLVIICAFCSSWFFAGFASFYMSTLLIQEISTPFVNLRWYLGAYGLQSSRAYKANFILAALIFFWTRVVFSLYVVYHIAQAYLSLWDIYLALDWATARYFNFVTCLAVFHTILNFVWFVLVCRAAYRIICRPLRKSRDTIQDQTSEQLKKDE
eukprot:TRINITY_DN9336_c0_g1::TRINITY_DN9336_c0_g1_i1::g.28419::m.28419 TRINITY_DN9336_c0_g1::TRINITY_DN9336_c0_g1_i1::g.28419  ORF type:complete len:271 (-),score=20.77,sp/Q5XIY2/TM56B_DANRE/28.51/1e-16,TRAM_LAG1_CLN8/PF03798.11/5e+03,TRAM_LAG1_CLN8/PF03798.11/2.8e-24,DUF373/PF04123.8/0.98 TRINITY_DN9336_c0_g1_i1:439-1251(-)